MGENDVVSEIKKDHIYALAREGRRFDGRAFDEYRPIRIQTNLIQQAEGSARVQIGDTDVFVGVKMAIGEPYADSPKSGVLTTSAELIPMASPTFEPGPPRPAAIELARVVDRGIRETKTINVEKLCIVEGEKVWMTYVDIHIVDYDGNLFDAASLGAICALVSAKVPASKHEVGEDMPMPVDHLPIMTTGLKLGSENAIVLDPGLAEDQVGGPRLSVSTDENGDIRAMQKGLVGGLTRNEVKWIVATGRERARDIREQVIKATGFSLP
ncbi:MAG TPA: exosome complex protein Rrp42 [Candidatus Thermoplasmatota archaeon]|nr:exosome complex protein Rrp42 [Candidatus Thermoplasmatota archaeon]